MSERTRGGKRGWSRWLKPAIWGGLIVLTVVLLALRLGRPRRVAAPIPAHADGVDVTYSSFNQENRQTLRLRCAESKQETPDRLRMLRAEATIFKRGHFAQDVVVSAREGVATNNLHNFDFTGEAKIASKDIAITAEAFHLKDLDVLTTDGGVAFAFKGFAGVAGRGLEGFLKINTYKFFDASGTFQRGGEEFRYAAQTLWLIEEKNWLILDKEGLVESGSLHVRGDWVSFQFDDKYQHLQSFSSIGNADMTSVPAGGGSGFSIAAAQIQCVVGASGKIDQIEVLGATEVALTGGEVEASMACDHLRIELDPARQALKKLELLAPGSITLRESQELVVMGSQMALSFHEDGKLQDLQVTGEARFTREEIQGRGERLGYDFAAGSLVLSGKDCSVSAKGSTFQSSELILDSEKSRVVSRKPVRAVLSPPRDGVLLSARPAFVNAGKMESDQDGDRITFTGKVHLLQDDTELAADRLSFSRTDRLVTAAGGTKLTFQDDKTQFAASGDGVELRSADRTASWTGRTTLRQGGDSLTGGQLLIRFGQRTHVQSIRAQDGVTFTQGDLRGEATELDWLFEQERIQFHKQARITRQKGGTTSGRELLLDLKTRRITVLGETGRTETIFDG